MLPLGRWRRFDGLAGLAIFTTGRASRQAERPQHSNATTKAANQGKASPSSKGLFALKFAYTENPPKIDRWKPRNMRGEVDILAYTLYYRLPYRLNVKIKPRSQP